MGKDYDIPDENRPEQEFPSPDRERNDKYMYNESQLLTIGELKKEAIKLIKLQNDGWDNNGDLFASQDLRNFVVKNKRTIMGVLKDLKWAKWGDDWDLNIRWYYEVANQFIKRSRYALNNYKKANKKILIRFKQRR